ncbi:hypothetical protein ABID58_004370 [Bradyrhizobium sp. S3.2.6]
MLDPLILSACFGAAIAALLGTFASVVTLTSVMWLLQTGRLAFP